MPELPRKLPRLLVSANDPSVAFHLCEVIRHAENTGLMELTLLAGPPAHAIFKQAGFTVHPFSSGRVSQQDSVNVSAILEEAATLISTFTPDAILVGLSGPDRGVDEALVAQSRNIPTYAIQDFWGDVNPGFGKLPGTYFVLDEKAAELTLLRTPSSRIVVTGSARHAAIAQFNPPLLREAFRSNISTVPLGKIAVFFGQPFGYLHGYGVTLSKTAKALARAMPGATMLYRAHPKETLQERRQALNCLTTPGLSVALDESPLVESSLCGADISFSCFSTCGMVLASLNRVSTTPLSHILYLLFESDVRNFYCDTSRIEDIPLSMMGLATTVWQEIEIESAIKIALMESERERKWRMAQEKIVESSGASERIVSTVVGDLSISEAKVKFSKSNAVHGN